MFESVAQPGCFLRLKDGACDIMVSADIDKDINC